MKRSISKQTLQRLPLYLNYLKTLSLNRSANISATTISNKLGLNQVQVRKDLAAVTSGGRPKTGYLVSNLIAEIEQFLRYDHVDNVVIAGAGRLGTALMTYASFKDYGIEIVAAFDVNEDLIGTSLGDKTILSINNLKNVCTSLKINIGIIAVPKEAAQSVCEKMIDSGIRAIWNFAPVHLNVPDYVLVRNENMAASLALLSQHFAQKAHESH
ncbi:redox-sensing transcriptional repressor Rex [Desulfitobacterium sp. AusDCA]|uniref:redox-sensing transcriptional repressor Rex n=1 Tax=Desulfitobacterium sp. AusDCA TaxID=3240383 RepID=UPI003DA6F262